MKISITWLPRIAAALSLLAALALCPSDGSAQSSPRRVVFDGVKSEHKWTLKELNPDWPADWSGWNYLVLRLHRDVQDAGFFRIKAQQGAGAPVFALHNVSDLVVHTCSGVPDTQLKTADSATL